MDALVQRVLDKQFAKRVAERWYEREQERRVAEKYLSRKAQAS